MKMRTVFFLSIVALAYGVIGVLSQDCSGVDCSNYSVDLTYGDAGRQECRWKIVNGDTEKRKGLEVFTYAMKGNDPAPNTKLCKTFKQIMTAAPKSGDNTVFESQGSQFDQCCAPKVMNFCYFEVRLESECGNDDTRADDDIKKVIVNFKAKGTLKGINVKFNPVDGNVECLFSYNGKVVPEKTVQVDKQGDTPYRVLCGDNDLKVAVSRQLDGAGRLQLKVSREQCMSQYVAMFTDPDTGTEKFTTRTALEKDDVFVDGASMKAVLGKTSAGWCGPITESVDIEPESSAELEP